LNIGIDATCWWNNRGFGRFTRELLPEIFRLDSGHRFQLFTDQPIPEVEVFDNVELTLVPTGRVTTEAAVADSYRSPVDMLRMGRAVASSSVDLMFFPAVYSWFPVPPRLPTVVTVMDAIAEHFPELIFPNWRSRLFWSLKMKGALMFCDRVLTITNAAKQEIIEYIGVSPEIIDISGCAPGPEFVRVTDENRMAQARSNAGLPDDHPFIVYVGGMAPHKNLHGLLDGFEIACRRGDMPETRLALVGDYAGAGFYSNYDSLLERVKGSVELRDRVVFTGYVSDNDLVALYSCARAAAMPSFSEGFGLPAVEAMACSTPVLSSTQGSLPEVVRDGGVFFDPNDKDDIAAAIVRMVSDDGLWKQLSGKALARSREYTWARAAQLAMECLERVKR
jgi:glycosyltransferase involved in cell wall biosynthesis